jgi:MYXO-CTERM domain-containing protein
MSETSTPDQEPVHDVLAAEMFGMPAPDPELHHHGPVQLPGDPTGIEEPHDVLAAEEFPMPAPRPGGHLSEGHRSPSQRAAIAGAGLLLVALLLRRRRRV